MQMPNTGLAVDGACSGNPGPSKYRGVDIRTGEIVFSSQIGYATNNICEFLALCHAIGYAIQNGQTQIYSDSVTAIAWVSAKRIKSNLVQHEKTKKAHDLVHRSLEFLKTVTIEHDGIDLIINNSIAVSKWHTSEWGEISADYGNKI
jgi:ribonuclease HI